MKNMFKHTVAYLIALTMLTNIGAVFCEGDAEQTKIVWQINNTKLIVNETEKEVPSVNGSTPVIVDSNVMIPIRPIIDVIGGTVEWLELEQEVFIIIKNNRILCWPDFRVAQTTGSVDPSYARSEVWIAVAPRLINGRMCVPIEFLEKNVGCDVNYDVQSQNIEILYNPNKDLRHKPQPTPVPTPVPTQNSNDVALKKVGGTGIDSKLLFKQKEDWYGTPQAIEIADKFLAFQRNSGGWPKNTDMVNTTPEEIAEAIKSKDLPNATLDNGATSTQIRFLAKVFHKTHLERIKAAIDKGMMYVISAQYPNGGWPQSFPIKESLPYHRYVTYNDGAMANILEILLDITYGNADYADLGEDIKAKAKAAFEKGLECVLKTQIVVNGKKTAWAQQYEPKTLKPAKGRPREHASISGAESTGVMNFLMKIENPSPEVIDAIQSAVKWFDDSKIVGFNAVKTKTSLTLVEDANAKTLWARFYDIETNKPFVVTVGERKTFDLNNLDPRQLGYQWFGPYGGYFIKNYTKWAEKWLPEQSRIKVDWK